MPLVPRLLDELRRAPYKGPSCSRDDNGKGLPSLAPRCVVYKVTYIFLNGQRFARDGGLVSSNDGVGSNIRAAGRIPSLPERLLGITAVPVIVFFMAANLSQPFLGFELFVDLKVFRAAVITDKPRVGRYRIAFLDNNLGYVCQWWRRRNV